MKKEYREIVTFRRERPSDRAITKQLNMPPDMVSGDNATSVPFLPKKCVGLLKRFTLFTYMSVNLSVNTCTHVF